LSNGTWTKETATAVQRGISVAINADSKDVSGKTVRLGSALTAAVSPADAAVTYQWQQNTGSDQSPVWTNVATGASYTPAKAGTYRVVATLGSGETVYTGTPNAKVTVSSATLDSVTIANTNASDANPGNKVDDTLTVQAVMAGNKNVAEDSNVKYQWYRVANGTETEIKDQTRSTYQLTADDVNATVYAKATYGGVTVKSNEITGIKNALNSNKLVLASTTDNKSAEVTVNNASADITWYEFAGTNAANKTVLKKATTGTKFTPTIANANKVYYAVAEGTGNYAGKVMLANKVSVDQNGNVTLSTETIDTNLTSYVFE
jgi:hypothetical protein